MASATGGDAQLGLRIELSQGTCGPQVRLHAGPALLAPGLRLAGLVAEPAAGPSEAAAPRSTAALRAGAWRVLEVRLEVGAPALEQAAQRLVGGAIAGWPIEQVRLELGGEQAVLTLTGPREDGWPGLIQVQAELEAAGGAIQIAARTVWATAPLAASGSAIWRAIARALTAGREGSVRLVDEAIEVDPGWALRRAFRAAGAHPPHTRRLRVTRLRGEGRGLRVVLMSSSDMFDRTCFKKSNVIGDPLAGLRAALRAGDQGGALRELDAAKVPAGPGARRLGQALAQVRAELLRFSDRAGGAAALRAWLAAAPDDPEVWWRMVVQHARAGEAEGLARGLLALERMPGSPAATLIRRAARSLVEAEQIGSGARARAGLEDMILFPSPSASGDAPSTEALAVAWRALAIARAADAAVGDAEVEAGLATALAAAAKGSKRWCEDEELRARVGAARRRSGRGTMAAGVDAAAEIGRAGDDEGEGVREVEAGEGVRAADAAGEGAEVVRAAIESVGDGVTVDEVDVGREAAELAAVALRSAREGAPGRLRAAVAASASRCGMGRLGAKLRAQAEQTLDPGAVLALGAIHNDNNLGVLGQFAAFMLPGVELATSLLLDRKWSEVGIRAGIGADDGEPRGHLIGVLWDLNFARLGRGIRASGGVGRGVDLAVAAEVEALAEEELGPLRAAVGLRLPLRIGRGGGEGGVTILNEREPAIVVAPGWIGLAPQERRFRLALAAALIRGGLAVVLDPAGASLHELLAALLCVASPPGPPGLPGAQTIVRVWRKRGLTSESLAPGVREALAAELRYWRQDDAHVARLAALLREDHVEIAARMSGALDGALLAIGRDLRLLEVHDEASARRVLATEEARRLLRGVGIFLKDEEGAGQEGP